MKALPKRKGNLMGVSLVIARRRASMKALPKRKGNAYLASEKVAAVKPQ